MPGYQALPGVNGHNNRQNPIIFQATENFLQKNTHVSLVLKYMRAPYHIELTVEFNIQEVPNIISVLVQINCEHLLPKHFEERLLQPIPRTDIKHVLKLVVANKLERRVKTPIKPHLLYLPHRSSPLVNKEP